MQHNLQSVTWNGRSGLTCANANANASAKRPSCDVTQRRRALHRVGDKMEPANKRT